MEDGDRELFESKCLKAHNEYRAKHGAPPLTLSREICRVSQNWANRLASTGVLQHNSGSGYGENLYYAWSSDPNYTISGTVAVDAWYKEIKDYNFRNGGFSYGTGHFTQVVWKKSKELGVGFARSGNGQLYVVCNYSPPGNYQGQFNENVLPAGTKAPNTSGTTTEEPTTTSTNNSNNSNNSNSSNSNSSNSSNVTKEDLSGFSQYEIDCLNAHNQYRAKHGVPPLKLSRKICQFSQSWASNIASRDVLQHSSGSGYGENIYQGWANYQNMGNNGKNCVDCWYDEIKSFRFGYGGFSMSTGHFTQVVWRDTKELGVAFARARNNKLYVVANYYPPGNYQGRFNQNVPPPKY